MLGKSPANPVQLNAADYMKPLLAALLKARKTYGRGRVVAGDVTDPEMTCNQLFIRAFVLKRKLDVILSEGRKAGAEGSYAKKDPSTSLRSAQDDNQYVGLLLPNTLAVLVTFFSLHMLKKIPCMLNFTAGQANMLHACRISAIRTIITSRKFVERGKLDGLVAALAKHYTILYLEDVRPTVTRKDKLAAALDALFPDIALRGALAATKPDDPAVVLYTSGSEGTPKGVALSHANILSNIAQARLRLDLTPPHTVFNALPVFHSFGLTVGMLMPVLAGLKTYLYPSPVQYKQIPAEVYKSGATIMLGTDTFFQGYARYCEPHHFSRIKLAVAGAEKLKDSTRQLWLDRFGIDILQGYGVTEASPVISVNTPAEHRPGSVGRLFPSMEHRLEPVEGLARGARLSVKGPNVMLGYLKADHPGAIQPQGPWYDTGDVVEVSRDGYITILGRAKRFAKVAGEMVSLAVCEELAAEIVPEQGHAAIAISDERKGEQIVMYTESSELTKEKLLKLAQEKGLPELYLPRQILRIDVLPRLGSGKVDYISLKNSMARNSMEQA